MVSKKLSEIRKHYIHTDGYEYLIGRYCSSWLVYWIRNTPVTPNQLTLVSIFMNLCAAVSFSRGSDGFLVAGAGLLQIGFVFDFADGQLARYRGMTTGFGKWLDILGDAMSDCIVYAGLAYGLYMQEPNRCVIALALFTCALLPLYCLHRQVRDHIQVRSEVASTNYPNKDLRPYIQAFRNVPVNKKLIFSAGTALALPKLTLLLVAIVVTVKFLASVLVFILQSKAKTKVVTTAPYSTDSIHAP